MSPVSFFFPHFLLGMTRSQTHSHTTESKTDTTTASGGSSINTAAVFQAMIQQAQKLYGFMKDGPVASLRILKILQTKSSVEYMK